MHRSLAAAKEQLKKGKSQDAGGRNYEQTWQKVNDQEILCNNSSPTGDEEFDNQLELVNDKVIKNEFSFDTNYNTNSDVIQKIQSGEITNTKTKFLLSGETESKSILERLDLFTPKEIRCVDQIRCVAGGEDFSSQWSEYEGETSSNCDCRVKEHIGDL